MKTAALPSFSYAAKAYCLLTKPGIIMGNVMTTAGGFALASKGHFDILLFMATLLGISFVIGSACVFNNYIDRFADQLMTRTQNRPLAQGSISVQGAIVFGLLLGVAGACILAFFTNLLTVAMALMGLAVYVGLYSFSKYRSIHGTLIGSVAGALPPVVGYCAVSNQLDAGGWILFAMIALWQMPHFFAIAIYRMEDYAKASIPVLPIVRGIKTAKVHMLSYILAFLGVSALLAVFGYAGWGYLILSVSLSLVWIALCARGFKCSDDRQWARQMFIFSLIIVTAQCLAIPFSRGA